MFELKDLPSYDTLAAFGEAYHNPDVDGLQAWLLWASSTSAMLCAFEDNLARHGGLSQSQFFVLLLLKRHPDGLSVGRLARGVAVTSQTMTRLIDRMEGAGLCLRTPDPADRRAWLIRLASAGCTLLDQVLPAHYAWVARLMHHFNTEERQMLKQLMQKLHAANIKTDDTPLRMQVE